MEKTSSNEPSEEKLFSEHLEAINIEYYDCIEKADLKSKLQHFQVATVPCATINHKTTI